MQKTRLVTHAGRNAFTLVELLVVIGIIAVLIGILIPAVSHVRDSANSAKCMANLRSIGTAIFGYVNDNDGCLMRGDGQTSGTTSVSGTSASTAPDPGPWYMILGQLNYIQLKAVSYPGGMSVPLSAVQALDSMNKSNVLRCPSGEGFECQNAGQLQSLTNTYGRGYTLRPSQLTNQITESWYACNMTLQDDPTLATSYPGLINPFYWSVQTSTTPPKITPRRLPSIKNSSRLVLIFDGVWGTGVHMSGGQFVGVSARHESYQRTNVLFGDGHADSCLSTDLWKAAQVTTYTSGPFDFYIQP